MLTHTCVFGSCTGQDGAISAPPVSKFTLPRPAVPAELPAEVRLQIVTSSAKPPEGEGWLHEIKHDGHRLVAIVAGGSLQLLSRNGFDRTSLFRQPFGQLVEAGLPPLVIDGEIAVPDDRGVTHLDRLNAAISDRAPGGGVGARGRSRSPAGLAGIVTRPRRAA